MDDARIVAALSDEYARRILSACVRKAKSAKEIEHEAQLPQATVYRQIGRLLKEGMLVVERSAITEDGKRYELYRSRVRSARIEMDGSGVRIVWEPVEEMEERLVRVWNSLRGV